MRKNNKYRVEEEQIDIHPTKREHGASWVVLKNRKLKRAQISKYEHDTAKGDLYVGLYYLCEDWGVEVPVGGDLVSDISLTYQGARFYLEVDLGNENLKDLFWKIERYIQFAGSGEKVIFVLKDGKYKAEK